MQWGTWSEVGYAARVGADRRTDLVGVFPSFKPEKGKQALQSVWQGACAHITVTQICGGRLAEMFPGAATLSSAATEINNRHERYIGRLGHR